MAPSFQDKDLLLQLNHIFDENDTKSVKFSLDKIRNPSVDGTRDIIISVLTEMGFALNSSSNILDLPNHLTGPNEFNIVKEFITPMTLTVTANKFFTSLASASGETNPIYRFGLNDIIMPDPKRLRYFLSHFVNFWLFCNANYDQFSQANEEINAKVNRKFELEAKIEKYHKNNEELKVSKANLAMKTQKMKEKIEQDKMKIAKLGDDVTNFTQQAQAVKEELKVVQGTEVQLLQEKDQLVKNELRLKTISKADEIKQELEEKLEDLKVEGSEKMIQIQNYRLNEEKTATVEENWKDILENCANVISISTNVKSNLETKRVTMMDCESSNESLETIEAQLHEIQKMIQILKSDIALASQKWEKNKCMRESDLQEYNAQLKSLSLATCEDDLMTNELDTMISETMMACEEVKESIAKHKTNVESCYGKLVSSFDKFFNDLVNEMDELKQAYRHLNGKQKL